MNYDVAIIGSGPAGGIAACRLAGSGLKVIVLESKQLPRTKPCGGLMPGGALSLLNWDVSHLVEHRVSQLEYFNNFEQRHVNTINNGELVLVNRALFDQGLVNHACKIDSTSISLQQKCNVRDVVETVDHVEISGEGFKKITADWVIAADGAVSRTARCLGLNTSRINGVTMDAEIRVSDACYSRFQDRVVFNYYCLPQGYGWIFPKAGPFLSCGVGSWGASHDIRNAVSDYLANSFSKNEVLNATIRGFPIPIYSGPASIASRRVCLAGDAASLVNPVSGEGIRFAMWSGKIAAESIIDLVSKSDSKPTENRGCGLYQERVYSRITKSLDHTLRFAALAFTQAPELYYQRFIQLSTANPHYT